MGCTSSSAGGQPKYSEREGQLEAKKDLDKYESASATEGSSSCASTPRDNTPGAKAALAEASRHHSLSDLSNSPSHSMQRSPSGARRSSFVVQGQLVSPMNRRSQSGRNVTSVHTHSFTSSQSRDYHPDEEPPSVDLGEDVLGEHSIVLDSPIGASGSAAKYYKRADAFGEEHERNQETMMESVVSRKSSSRLASILADNQTQ